MQRKKNIMQQICTKDAAHQRCTTPKIQCSKDAPKMQRNKDSPHQRCIAPKVLLPSYVDTQKSLQNKFSVKFGILSQRGGRGSEPIPTFINHCFYGIFDPFLPGKFTVKIPTFKEKGGVKPVGTKSQL